MSEEDKALLPNSLGHYSIEPEVLEQIGAHVNRLSETALRVSEELPLGASAGDIFRVLEQE